MRKGQFSAHTCLLKPLFFRQKNHCTDEPGHVLYELRTPNFVSVKGASLAEGLSLEVSSRACPKGYRFAYTPRPLQINHINDCRVKVVF